MPYPRPRVHPQARVSFPRLLRSLHMTRLWYVGPNRAPVNWSMAVVNGLATTQITEITDPGDAGGPTFETVWAYAGKPVSAARVTAAQAAASSDAVPARRPVPPKPTSPSTPAPVTLPKRLVVTVVKAIAEDDHAAGSWPTARPSVPEGCRVFYVGDTDPGATIALPGDRWDRVPS